MTKQQAAETKYPFHREDDVKDKAELRNLRDAFCRGWEAHEVQSPTDAVAFAEWIDKMSYFRVADSSWVHQKERHMRGVAPNTAELYKLFNPSAEDKQLRVDTAILGDLYSPYTDIDLSKPNEYISNAGVFNPSGTSSRHQENAEPTPAEALKEAHETIKWMWDNMTINDKSLQSDAFNRPANALHIIELAQVAPPAAAPEKIYPIGGYAPGNYTCICSTCGSQFIGDKRAVQCEPCAVEVVRQVRSTLTGGPVWVKASEKMPPHPGSPQNHWRLDGFHKAMGNFYDDEGEMFFGVHGCGCFEDYSIPKEKFDRVEWLDESPIQVFTREQVEEIAAKWSITLLDIKEGKIPHIGNGHDFNIWFNDNYPPSK